MNLQEMSTQNAGVFVDKNGDQSFISTGNWFLFRKIMQYSQKVPFSFNPD